MPELFARALAAGTSNGHSSISITSTTPYLLLVVVGTVFAVFGAFAIWVARVHRLLKTTTRAHATVFGHSKETLITDPVTGVVTKHEDWEPGLVDRWPKLGTLPEKVDQLIDRVDGLEAKVEDLGADVAGQRQDSVRLQRTVTTMRRTQLDNGRETRTLRAIWVDALGAAGITVPPVAPEGGSPLPRQRFAPALHNEQA